MLGIIGIIALLVVLGLSLFINQLATIALAMTGLSRESAAFQARSAFTGTGYTTHEAEKIVNHPVRRRIIMLLMMIRSAGLVTIIVSIILSFVGTAETSERLMRLLWLVGGVVVLLGLSRLTVVNRAVELAIGWALDRWTDLNVRDYAELLQLSGEYTVTEKHVDEGDWVAGKKLHECDLDQEGVSVLGIQREDESYLGAPRANTEIYAGDTLVLYGRSDTLAELDRRREGGQGDAAHRQAVNKQKREVHKQQAEERRQAEDRRQQEQEDAEAENASADETQADQPPGEEQPVGESA
ncbi:MAG: TrkA C-terminal domain-containing protein [Phycisphaerae bacterium]